MRFLYLLLVLLPSLTVAQRTVDVSGTVRDEMGKPVAGAQLSAQRAQSTLTVEAKSAADGTYSLPNLPVSSYVITIQASGYVQRRLEVTLTGSDDKAMLDVTLAHEASGQEAPDGPAFQTPSRGAAGGTAGAAGGHRAAKSVGV